MCRPQERCINLRKLPLNHCLLLFLSFRTLCAVGSCTSTTGECCWWPWIAKQCPSMGQCPTLCPTLSLLPWFSPSAVTKRWLLPIVWSFMAKAQGTICILPLHCPNAPLHYYAFLSSEQENRRGFVLSLHGFAFLTVQSRNAVLPLHLYFFIATWIFHVETLMQVIFCLSILCSFFVSKLRLF